MVDTTTNGKTQAVELSPRLREVLAGIASGRPHKQVADEMGLTYATFQTYRKRLYVSLGIHSEVEATRMAVGLAGQKGTNAGCPL
jgi:DNA-binding NarL/FixJ family response regulator